MFYSAASEEMTGEYIRHNEDSVSGDSDDSCGDDRGDVSLLDYTQVGRDLSESLPT